MCFYTYVFIQLNVYSVLLEGVMAKKYHINEKGRVEECRARIRSCPFEDYHTEEAARTSAYLKSEKERLQRLRESIEAKFRQPVTDVNDLRLDFDANPFGDNFLALKNLEKLDELHESKGLLYLSNRLTDSDFDASEVQFTLNMFPQADFKVGKIYPKWKLSIWDKYRDMTGDYVLDFDNNYHQTIQFLREKFRAGSVRNIRSERSHSSVHDDVADRLLARVEQSYVIGEEEFHGPFKATKKFDELGIDTGSFAGSKEYSIHVDVDAAATSFRPSMLREYIKNNRWLNIDNPNTLFRVYHSESGASSAWWALVYNDDNGWGVQTRVGASDPEYVVFADPEDTGIYIENFVKNEMRTNDDITAYNSRVYADQIRLGVQEVLDDHKAHVHNEIYGSNNVSANKNDSEQHNSFLGKTEEKSTLNSILGLFS